MKKSLMSVFLFLFFLNGFSQSRIGYKLDVIKKEYADSKYQIKSGYTDSAKILYLEVTLTDTYVIHYFDSAQICNRSVIVPNDEGILNGLVEYYNKNYVIISDTKWKRYTNTGILNAGIDYTKDHKCYIYWEY